MISLRFDEAHLDETCKAPAMGGRVDDADEARAWAAHRKVGDCDSWLAKYRAALDAGVDAKIVGQLDGRGPALNRWEL